MSIHSNRKPTQTFEGGAEDVRSRTSLRERHNTIGGSIYATHYTGHRRTVANILENFVADGVVASVILLHFVLVCLDTDLHVETPGEEPHPIPMWVNIGMLGCYVFFVGEMVLKVFVEQSKYLHNNWNRFDIFLIACTTFEVMAQWGADIHIEGIGAVRLLDTGRLLRLLRVLRLFSLFKELRRLMYMFARCFKTIGWSFLLLLTVMTIWSCIAVQLIHPIIMEMGEQPAWEGHYRARRAFASVFNANVTLWQTIVAHDSWGLTAIPVIEYRPWTAFIFAGALLTMVFGVLNLIVAVIVDTCAEDRAKDFMNKALDIEEEEREQKILLSKMFNLIDEDKSGCISWEELREGAASIEEFKSWLRVMDVDEEDLQQVFTILDVDGSGTIDHDEFVEAMYRLKNAASNTTTRLIKFSVSRLEQQQHHTKFELGEVRSELSRVASEHMPGVKALVSQQHDTVSAKLRQHEESVVSQLQVAVARALDMAVGSRLLAIESELQSLAAQSAPRGAKSNGRLHKSPSLLRSVSETNGEYLSMEMLCTGDSGTLRRGLSGSDASQFGGSVRQLSPNEWHESLDAQMPPEVHEAEPGPPVGRVASQRSVGPDCPETLPARLLCSM